MYPFFRLIKEPTKLIKLGGDYRRAEQWSNAMKCYRKAAEDKHYGYVAYHSCLRLHPGTRPPPLMPNYDSKKRRKQRSKPSSLKIDQMQNAMQSITPLGGATADASGARLLENPYKAREEYNIQIWSIFLSAIDDAIGSSCSAESLKKSQFEQIKSPMKFLKKCRAWALIKSSD